VAGYGVVRLTELRRCLNSVSHLFLNDKEISMICQMLKTNASGDGLSSYGMTMT
jgi:hypothetical protein